VDVDGNRVIVRLEALAPPAPSPTSRSSTMSRTSCASWSARSWWWRRCSDDKGNLPGQQRYTKVDPQVMEAMLPYFSEYYGNPSSMHSFGGGVAAKIQQARENVARLIGALPDEIVFTSCGTESDGTAIRAASTLSCEAPHRDLPG